MSDLTARQNERYRQTAAAYGAAIARLACGYEADTEKRRELVQDMHVALWQSLAAWDEKCSLRTWTYRVAHNIGASHIRKSVRTADHAGVEIESFDEIPDPRDDAGSTESRIDIQRIMKLVRELGTLDRQIMLLYLDDLDAASIAEVTGLSAGNIATRVHRIKVALARRFAGWGKDHE